MTTFAATVLIVSHDEELVRVLKWQLEPRDYFLFSVADSDTATEIAASVVIDAIIMDDWEADEEYGRLREMFLSLLPGVPAILYTGRDLSEPERALVHERGDSYLPKPVALLRLQSELSRLAREIPGRRGGG